MENFRNDDLMYQCVTASYIIGVGKSAYKQYIAVNKE